MSRYDDIATLIRSAGSQCQLTPLSQAEVMALKQEDPRVPGDYLDFLHEVGWGMIRGGSYMIYSGLLKPSDIYDPETAADLSRILFFGDDFGGNCAGFDTGRGWAVVEVESVDMRVEEVGQTFEEFIRGQILAR